MATSNDGKQYTVKFEMVMLQNEYRDSGVL